jgi:hypothetical protein
VAAAIERNWNNPMKKYISRSFWPRLSLGALLLAAPALHGQTIQYPPGYFDISISFACNCTCFCETNMVDTNNPISMFLTANPVANIGGDAVMPPVGQVVPPHWTEFMSSTTPPYGSIAEGDHEGWTMTRSTIGESGFTYDISEPGFTYGFVPVTFSLNYPIQFTNLDYWFYADLLPPDSASPAGDLPIPAVFPSDAATQYQPYPWDVNLTLQLLNGQYYYMEQQLVVGYDPELGVPTPMNYVETNGLLTVSLYCTNGGVTNLLSVSSATITATLLPVNIPAPLDQTVGWTGTPESYTNWAWPLMPDDTVAPAAPTSPYGAAGTVQATLGLGSIYSTINNVAIDQTNLLVRANRAYRLDLAYWLGGYYIETLSITNTGVVPPCTNVQFTFYTDICSFTPMPNVLCWSTNVGMVDMMGAPDDPPGITMWASDFVRSFNTNLTGTELSGLPVTPVPFQLGVFMVNETSDDFAKWATEALGTNTAYEYFWSPWVYPVGEYCNGTINLTNDFVMCPTNPAIVMGTVTLNGCVDTNYYGGAGALSFLQFAVYPASGLPYDPYGVPRHGNPDPTLLYVSSIEATNGASSAPFNIGRGGAITEFDNPGGFAGPNIYTGRYSLQLAGLQSQPSVWDVNDLHLVFGSPVDLDYHVYETSSPYTNVPISCGTILTNNIALCFGLVTITVTNDFPDFAIYNQANLVVSGTGPGYTVGPLNASFPFTSQTSSDNEAIIQLFLPEGSYEFTGTVLDTSSGSGLTLATNSFQVSCCSTNCCSNCFAPYPESYTVTVYPGTNYLANDLCQGTNNTVADLLPSVPIGTVIYIWDQTTDTYIIDQFASERGGGVGWISGGTARLSPGEGFILISTNTYTLTISGCQPDCPPPCTPANGFSLVGAYGTSTATWSNLFSCPPVCGTEVLVFNPVSQQFTTNTYVNGAWTPQAPVLAVGQSAWVDVNPNPGIIVSCPTSKTVQCGSSWTFDQPVASSCCTNEIVTPTGLETNVAITVTGTVTNGVCPLVTVTRTWNLADGCNNSATCSQTVTIVGCCATNPLNITNIFNFTAVNNSTTPQVTFNLGLTNGTFAFTSNGWSVLGGNYNYILQTTTNLELPNWMTVSDAIPSIGFTFTNVSPVNFYRLLLQTNP